ncbi:hypothetical protein GALL_405290 [mine drainage metagenome]|jgi:hypothetical protein|uniref:Ferrochelatase n=1 Tax=mine drainage metagenome TaxID=410659 RepID=A0A1J5QCQ6_9ZZZZ
MKKLALAAALSLAATSTFAGNLKPPVMEAPVAVAKAQTSSSSSYLVPLILLVVVAAAVAANK